MKLKIFNSKKAAVGKAMDLILLILFSVAGFLLVNTFFLQAAEGGVEGLTTNAYEIKSSNEALSILMAPISVDSGTDSRLEVPLYQILASGKESYSYRTEIIALFDELYGEDLWSIRIGSEYICKLYMHTAGDGCYDSSCQVNNIIQSYNAYVYDSLDSRSTSLDYITGKEIIPLINLDGEEIYLHIVFVGSVI